MQRMLNDLGFVFRERKRNSALLVRDDIVAWRRKYLRTIREMRRQQRPLYYLDETWVNAGHTKEDRMDRHQSDVPGKTHFVKASQQVSVHRAVKEDT
ncbi:hypothetical protein MTO96_017079 [Rhipicephalus appendiculatus]